MHRHAVHRATPADMPQLLAMMEPFNAGEHIQWERSRFEHALAPLLADDAFGVVAIGRGPAGAAGYAVVTWGYDLEFGGRDAFLTELYVRPAVQRTGWGAALLAWAEAAARAGGAGAIHLTVRHDNASARALYAREGFAAPPRELLSKPL
jgi:ribosomal protein S18 acetylase RimI-like enzyme